MKNVFIKSEPGLTSILKSRLKSRNLKKKLSSSFFTFFVEFLQKEKIFIVGPDKQHFEHNNMFIFYSVSLNMCYGCSKELSHYEVR